MHIIRTQFVLVLSINTQDDLHDGLGGTLPRLLRHANFVVMVVFGLRPRRGHFKQGDSLKQFILNSIDKTCKINAKASKIKLMCSGRWRNGEERSEKRAKSRVFERGKLRLRLLVLHRSSAQDTVPLYCHLTDWSTSRRVQNASDCSSSTKIPRRGHFNKSLRSNLRLCGGRWREPVSTAHPSAHPSNLVCVLPPPRY